MAQGQGGSAIGRQIDYTGKEEFRSESTTGSGDFLCTFHCKGKREKHLCSDSHNFPMPSQSDGEKKRMYKLTISRNHTQSSPNSSVPSANVTPTDQAATPESSASNPSKNTNTTPHPRATRTPNPNANPKTKPHPQFSNSSTDPRICVSP